MDITGFERQNSHLIKGDITTPVIYDFYIKGQGYNAWDNEQEKCGKIFVYCDERDIPQIQQVLRDLADKLDDIPQAIDAAYPFLSSDEKDNYQWLLANGRYDDAIRFARGDQDILDWIEAYGINHPNR